MIPHKYLIFILLLLKLPVSGQSVYHINTQYPVHDLSDQIQIIEEDQNYSTQQLISDSSIFDIQEVSSSLRLQAGKAYWARVKIQTSEALNGWKLHLEDKSFGSPAWVLSNGKVDVYAFVHQELLFRKKSGIDYLPKDRDISESWMLNRVSLNELPLNQAVTLLIRVEGNNLGYPPFFNLTLRSPDFQYYHPLFEFNTSFNIFMLGVTFIIFLYHLLQFLYLKQRIFLWFSVWLFFCTITQAMAVGFILGNLSTYSYPVWMVSSSGIFYTFWFFGRSFINSPQKFPLIDKLILGLSFFMFAEIIATVFYILIAKPKPFFTNVGIHYQMIIFYALISFLLSLVLIFKKDQLARYFGFGAFIISSAFMLGGLWTMGWLRPPIDPFSWGLFLQIIVYSFGIAYRQQKLALISQEEKLEAERSINEMKRIKEIDEIKTRFFSNISHEFRTPLTLIRGPLEASRKKSASDHATENIIEISDNNFNVIQSNAQRLEMLVDQLLDLSKIESGKSKLTLIQDDIIQFLRFKMSAFESIALQKQIHLHLNDVDEVKEAFYDQDKLDKIFTNVLSNALKYTPAGGQVDVSLRSDGRFIIIVISDTGKGMEEEEVKRIFDRFYRVEGSEERGSGIGLALTKELVDLYKGVITVQSQKQLGTTFTIKLPIGLQDLPASISISATKPRVNHTDQSTIQRDNKNQVKPFQKADERPTILIVEDNLDLTDFIIQIVSSQYQTMSAVDGAEGEAKAKECIPDIILTDVMMPEKDGYELCRSLKSNVLTSHIPIVMLTAKAAHSNKIEGLSLRADAYITKPFDSNELLLVIRNQINIRQTIWQNIKANNMAVLEDLPMSSLDDKFLHSVMGVIQSNIGNENFTVQHIAEKVGFSRSQLHRKLKALTNMSANQLITEIRLKEAYKLLKYKAANVSEVAYAVGFSNMSYFTKTFKKKFGKLPSQVP